MLGSIRRLVSGLAARVTAPKPTPRQAPPGFSGRSTYAGAPTPSVRLSPPGREALSVPHSAGRAVPSSSPDLRNVLERLEVSSGPVQAEAERPGSLDAQRLALGLQAAKLEDPAVQARLALQLQAKKLEDPAAQARVAALIAELHPEMTAQERAAYDALPPEAQRQYDQVARSVEGDPDAERALRTLLVNGELTAEAIGGDGPTLLDSMHRMATTPGKNGVDSGEALGQLVQDLAHPETEVAQGNGTYYCGATVEMQALARENPAEYARLIAGLALEGEVKAAGPEGDPATLTVVTGAITGEGQEGSITQRLLAPAVTNASSTTMTVSDGEGVQLPNARLNREYGEYGPSNGVTAYQKGIMSDILHGRPAGSTQTLHLQGFEGETPGAVDQALAICRDPEAGASFKHVTVDADGNKVAHWYSVADYQAGPPETYTLVDPNGSVRTVPGAEFEAMIRTSDTVNYDASAAPELHAQVVAGEFPPGHDDPGGGSQKWGGSTDGMPYY